MDSKQIAMMRARHRERVRHFFWNRLGPFLLSLCQIAVFPEAAVNARSRCLSDLDSPVFPQSSFSQNITRSSSSSVFPPMVFADLAAGIYLMLFAVKTLAPRN